MEILNPSFVIEDDIDGEEILRRLERYGRVCYKSEDKITPDSARRFIAGILKSGHESVIEHEKITVRIFCDRGVTHEIVRHRIASYSQKSTRYCNYKSRGIQVIEPFFFAREAERKTIGFPAEWRISGMDGQGMGIFFRKRDVNEFDVWLAAMLFAEWAYTTLVQDFKRVPQEARSVLPNSLKTEIVMTYNLREWRHFFKLRCSERAHPQMREVAVPILREFQRRIPIIFDDIAE